MIHPRSPRQSGYGAFSPGHYTTCLNSGTGGIWEGFRVRHRVNEP